jgi:hypothetical protein
MLTRRSIGQTCLMVLIAGEVRGQIDDRLTVDIRTDDAVRGLIPPISQQDLAIMPDQSPEARVLASRSPPARAVPVMLIIVGALALTQIIQLIQEMVRQHYYGGVVIDGRQSPPLIRNDLKIPADMVFVFLRDGSMQQFKSGGLPDGLLKTVLTAAK